MLKMVSISITHQGGLAVPGKGLSGHCDLAFCCWAGALVCEAESSLPLS